MGHYGKQLSVSEVQKRRLDGSQGSGSEKQKQSCNIEMLKTPWEQRSKMSDPDKRITVTHS